MPQTPKKLLRDALKLPIKQRAQFAEQLIASLDDEDGLEGAMEEAERRWKAYKECKIQAIPIDQIFPNLGRRANKT